MPTSPCVNRLRTSFATPLRRESSACEISADRIARRNCSVNGCMRFCAMLVFYRAVDTLSTDCFLSNGPLTGPTVQLGQWTTKSANLLDNSGQMLLFSLAGLSLAYFDSDGRCM